MATMLMLLLILPGLLETHQSQDHRSSSSLLRRGSGWPFWYDAQSIRSRHNGHNYSQWNQWNSKISSSTIPSATTRSRGDIVARHHVGQRILDEHHRDRTERTEKLVTSMTTADDTRLVGYRNDVYLHQLPGYQRVTTTPATYTRHHPGRRVCSRTTPPATHHRANQIRLVYTELSSGFFCCPGWTQVTRLSFGCNKPVCPAPCQNSGICGNSGVCSCPKGYTGSQCQIDVDECLTEKPCAQICRNLPGSYECYCRSGFQLQTDGQSCRKNDSDGTAFEARDLERDYGITTTTKRLPPRDTENEVGDTELDQDYEVILKRLNKLEKQIARGRKKDTEATEINNRITMAIESINEIKRSIENVQHMQHEIHDMRNKIKQFELETRKIQHLASRMMDLENRLRIRCRSNIIMNSGLRNY